MRILSLKAENIKRLKVVEIYPHSNVVALTGKNGQGKTSVMDCIWFALGGTDHIPSHPVRRGAEKGVIQLDLGELVVTREFSTTGVPTRLRVQSKSTRATFATPQKMLDNLLGPLSLDPIAFMRMKPKDQAQELKAIAKLEIDPDVLDAQNKGDYDSRREENRIVSMYEAQLAGMPAPPADLPAEPIEMQELETALEQAGKHNGSIEAAQNRLEAMKQQVAASRKTLAETNKRIEQLNAQIAAEDKAAKALEKVIVESLKAINSFVMPDAIDTTKIRERIETARAVNTQLEKKHQRDQVLAKRDAAQLKADEYTQSIKEREALKAKAIAEAKMPVEGLSFNDGEVYFEGLPLNQASGRDQLRISTSIAMSSNPQLRIIRITDGSGVDSDGMRMLEEMAGANDFQIWIERVDETGQVGIVMEDGEVVAVNEAPKVGIVNEECIGSIEDLKEYAAKENIQIWIKREENMSSPEVTTDNSKQLAGKKKVEKNGKK